MPESRMPPTRDDRSLQEIQNEIGEWSEKNFGRSRSKVHPFLGVVEEHGELLEVVLAQLLRLVGIGTRIGRHAHALLKAEQGIRGTPEEHEAAAQNAVGDSFIYLLDYCQLRGWRAGDILEKTWLEVKRRDWTKDPNTGGDGPPSQSA